MMKFVAYRSPSQPDGAIGSTDDSNEYITPLLLPDRSPLRSFQELVERWVEVKDCLLPSEPKERWDEVEILPPFRGRDVICVGKNYREHATEFAGSGFDHDTSDTPDFPIIFTKRATSIVGHNHPIQPHTTITDKLDYEGELGIIIGKKGLGVSKEDAWEYVWGATIINDVTARDKQRDHKQYYLGKSFDTFCPMGPLVVPASELDIPSLLLQTHVNGKLRQSAHISELIFDIPTLIHTCSMGTTLQPGDVIATGTPYGVGISSGAFLQPGDIVEVSITGLGTLRNVIADDRSTEKRTKPETGDTQAILVLYHTMSLLDLPSAKVYVETSGLETGSTVICIHGLGGSSSNFYPLVEAAELGKKYKVVLFDLPGHGLSPLGGQTDTKGVEGYVRCLEEVVDALKIEKAALVGHSMGCLIATTFASLYPKRVTKLCLLGPIKQFPSTPFQPLLDRASTARSSLSSFSTLSSTLSIGGTSPSSHSNHLVIAAVRTSILHTDPEGYARACEALAHATDPAYGSVEGDVLVISGHDDKTSTEQIGESLVSVLKGKREVVKGGHWMLLESVEQVAVLVKGFMID